MSLISSMPLEPVKSGSTRARFSLSPSAFVCILVAFVLAGLALQRILHLNEPRHPPILITEFCAHNGTGIRDEDGDHSDWIELYNAGAQAVNLQDWSLTDKAGALARWRFPAVQLAPQSYLLVFASGKNRHTTGSELHTNFKLNENGEYLALYPPAGTVAAQEYLPKYPRQKRDVSFGLSPQAIADGGALRASMQGHCYFSNPTPGRPNQTGLVGLAGEVRISQSSGFYEAPFKLTLACKSRGTTIHYTLDGSAPSPTNGIPYHQAIEVRGSVILRAIAFAPNLADSEVETRNYLFLSDVLKQNNDHVPKVWGLQDGWIAPAHYAMAQEIVGDPLYRSRLERGLRAIPSIMVVMDPEALFAADRGIYTHTMLDGRDWERPASVEMLDGEGGFRVNCGVRIQGGWSRRPLESPKHSIRLVFKKDYGPSKLTYPLFGTNGAVDLDTVILRGGNNNTWLHWNFEERRRADYLRDEWARQTFQAMGWPAARGRFVHLYLNGLYWGLYNLCERPSAPFMAGVQGGAKRDYDSMNAGKMLSGDKSSWNRMMALANAGLGDEHSYRTFQDLVDVPELTDYLILNFYGGNDDWDRSSNWYAARSRRPGGRYQFLPWDEERTLEGINFNSMDFDDDQSPPRLFHKLAENPEYRMFFADRVQHLLFNNGPLTSDPAAKRYEDLALEIKDAVVAESARWGSYRRDVHQYKLGPYEFYNPDEHWQPEVRRLLSDYFPQRPDAVVRQFRKAGLYPKIDAPMFRVAQGHLILTAKTGRIFYASGGKDPRTPGGHLCSESMQYAQPIPIVPGRTLKARALTGPPDSLEWSALIEF